MRRCAVYTRKSTENGLEQDFNTLHAQREACEAFIKSQHHEGWRLIRKAFDDGSYSGGTLNRPALQTLLEAVKRHEMDVIVVYKVDRLTRSLTDFAKIVELLDEHGVSFVSVTQQFNTTTSMGRLTLNVLLSFAQFEREVTAERIRDKIAASKKKGLWMGGLPPLGYDIADKKLVINPAEAQTVRTLFALYIEHGTVRRLKEKADRLGIVTKRRACKNRSEIGAIPFSRGNLYQLLSNPIYIGQIAHKGKTYAGQHDPIIDTDAWDTVQRILAGNAPRRSSPGNTKAPFLLTGLVWDETGAPLCQSQAVKQGRRYRYYISKRLVHEAHTNPDGWRLPAETLEDAVITILRDLLSDQRRVMDVLRIADLRAAVINHLKTQAVVLVDTFNHGAPSIKRDLLRSVVRRIELSANQITITLRRNSLAAALGVDQTSHPDENTATLSAAFALRRRGVEAKLVLTGEDASSRAPDIHLCRLIARARFWFNQLASGEIDSIRALAGRDGVHETEVTRILPLAFLAPEIVEAILTGRQPEALTVERLKRLSPFPNKWADQNQLLENLS